MDSLHKLKRSGTSEGSAPARTPLPKFPWKTRVLLPVAVIVALTVLMFAAGYDSFAPATEVAVAPVVQTSGVSAQPGAAVVQAAGWIEPDPFVINVSALADGIVEEVLVLESEAVERDQVVARMVQDDAQLELDQAEQQSQLARADLAAARAEGVAAQTHWDNPVELERAVASRSAELEETKALHNQIKAEITAESAILEEAESAYERANELLNENDVGTEAALDKEKARYQAQVATVEAQRKRGVTVLATIDRIDAELLAAKENLRLRTSDRKRLDEAEATVQRAEAAVLLAESLRDEKALQLERMAVRTPVDGIVLRRLVQPGAKVIRGMDSPHSTHVLHLYDPAKLQVRVDVPLVDAALISVGQRAEITVEVLADTVFEGEVTRVLHEADIQKNTLEVKVRILNPRPELRPEMLSTVRFLAVSASPESQDRKAVMAPIDALIREGNATRVWVVEDRRGLRGVARSRDVAVIAGPPGTGWAEVSSGLRAGDRVIIDPPMNLRNGARIAITDEQTPAGRE